MITEEMMEGSPHIRLGVQWHAADSDGLLPFDFPRNVVNSGIPVTVPRLGSSMIRAFWKSHVNQDKHCIEIEMVSRIPRLRACV